MSDIRIKSWAPVLGLLLLLLATMLAVACGTATDGGTSASDAKPPIKVGAAVALSGFMAGDGQNSLQGIEMAVKELNAKGGLLGRQLKVVKFDTQDLSPERLMLAADTLVEQEKCDVVNGGAAGFGGDVQAFGKFAVPYFHCDAQQGCLDIAKKNGYTNIWSLCDVETSVGTSQWNFVSTLDYHYPNKRVALVHVDDNWGKTTYATVAKMAEQDGWTVADYTAPFGTTQWNSILTKVRAQNPSLIMFDLQSATDMLTFMAAFQQKPTNSIISLGMGLPIREFQDAAKGKLNGYVGSTSLASEYPLPPASQGEQKWWTDFQKQMGNVPGGLSGYTYTGMMAWAAAVEAVGDPTKYAEINTWLENNSFKVWDGVPNLKFDADHCIRNAAFPLGFGQVQDGEMNTLWYGTPSYTDYTGKSFTFQVPSWVQ